MTEADWLACDDPRPLIGFLRARFSKRKARLFAVACCQLSAHLFRPGDGAAYAVEVAERYADGLASDSERSDAWGSVDVETTQPDRPRDSSWWADSAAETAVTGLSLPNGFYRAAAVVSREVLKALPDSLPAQLAIFRCIAGNPFRPAVVLPDWLSSSVTALATGVYTDRAFDRLPILADALEEAGCDDADLLTHCRGEGSHVRGCWVVDAVLGKS